MFCPNCGKKVNDYDNFCKFCGHDLREQEDNFSYNNEVSYEKNEDIQEHKTSKISVYEDSDIITNVEKSQEIDEKSPDEENEIVVYEIKKHYMALFWPIVFSPVFIAYFWIFYVNIPTFWGFIIALLVLTPIIYPILRYFSDRAVITTSNLHIRQGAFDVEEITVPLNKIHLVRLRRSYLGRLADYGHLIIEKENSDKEITYRYIQDPDDVQFILGNSKAYIAEYLKQ